MTYSMCVPQPITHFLWINCFFHLEKYYCFLKENVSTFRNEKNLFPPKKTHGETVKIYLLQISLLLSIIALFQPDSLKDGVWEFSS